MLMQLITTSINSERSNSMKKNFEMPEIEIVLLEAEDIMIASDFENETDEW